MMSIIITASVIMPAINCLSTDLSMTTTEIEKESHIYRLFAYCKGGNFNIHL